MSKPLVAIVGRPNVGKSHLFNRLVGKRISIVEDTPGITRDRLYAECEWAGHNFDLVDTGGIEPNTKNEMLLFMREQAQIAIDTADVIIFVCELKTGVTAADEDVAKMLQRSGKPLVLCVNKADTIGELDPNVYEFYSLGMGDPIPVSAVHGHGTTELLDEVIKHFGEKETVSDEFEGIKVAVVGKPNVGKSSLVNFILGEKRTIVSDIPGTTRDSVDGYVNNEYGNYLLIDTAGLRRKSKVKDSIEYFSVLRAKLAIDKSDVCLLMIDAEEGASEQDTKIAGLIQDAGKACIILVNKWDLITKETNTMEEERKKIYEVLSFMRYAPILFVSVKEGTRVRDIFELINEIYSESRKRVSTGLVNEVLGDAVIRLQPPSDKGRRLKLYYMTQTAVAPPGFVIFCNKIELFHFSYRRYIENRIREAFGFKGNPIRIIIKQKGDND
ncbi:MAG: ribosome biogenesis GTPase Der [Candidatus Scatomorpha sp.]|jgi:GTP-binding protein